MGLGVTLRNHIPACRSEFNLNLQSSIPPPSQWGLNCIGKDFSDTGIQSPDDPPRSLGGHFWFLN